MKNKEEFSSVNQNSKELKSLSKKLEELTEDELEQVVGGSDRVNPEEIEGIIVDILPNAKYGVELNGGRGVVQAYLSGKLRASGLILVTGDKVIVELLAYDAQIGRIICRIK